jgi:hypothetical protein
MPTNFDDFKIAVESLSGGKNTVLYDDLGMPSVMFIQPKLLSSDIITGATQTTHPGFILNSVEYDKVAISKYINIIVNGRAYSLPGQDPATYTTWDNSLAVCRAKGNGWGVVPYILWGAIAMWSRKNGTMPRGNNNYGSDHAYPHEKGVATYKETSGAFRTLRTATGSGPATWNHNWQIDGICDMNGDVWEWNTGLRIRMGEIQIIPYANCMDNTSDMSLNSTHWRAIMPDGTLVNPGTAGTLKLDYVSSAWQISDTITSSSDSSRSCSFTNMTVKSGIVVPQILKELAFYPAEPGADYGGDYFWANNAQDERMPLRGGHWYNTGSAGVFSSSLNNARSYSSHDFGFRSAYFGQL